VRPRAIVVADVDGQDALEVASAEDEHPVQALLAGCPNESLGDRVGPGRTHRRFDHPRPLGSKEGYRPARELPTRMLTTNCFGLSENSGPG
jgi:hypothetical protein